MASRPAYRIRFLSCVPCKNPRSSLQHSRAAGGLSAGIHRRVRSHKRGVDGTPARQYHYTVAVTPATGIGVPHQTGASAPSRSLALFLCPASARRMPASCYGGRCAGPSGHRLPVCRYANPHRPPPLIGVGGDGLHSKTGVHHVTRHPSHARARRVEVRRSPHLRPHHHPVGRPPPLRRLPCRRWRHAHECPRPVRRQDRAHARREHLRHRPGHARDHRHARGPARIR